MGAGSLRSRLGMSACGLVLMLAPMLASGCGAASTASTEAQRPRPHALELLINGKRQPIVPIVGGPDNYDNFPAGKMRVEARWANDAGGTGHYVTISTSEPETRRYAKCSTGTSCRVPKAVGLGANEELSWNVKIVRASDDKVVAGYKRCLEGSA